MQPIWLLPPFAVLQHCCGRRGPAKFESSQCHAPGTHTPLFWPESIIPPGWLACNFRCFELRKKPKSNPIVLPWAAGKCGSPGKGRPACPSPQARGELQGHGPAAPSASAQDPPASASAFVCICVLNCSVEVYSVMEVLWEQFGITVKVIYCKLLPRGGVTPSSAWRCPDSELLLLTQKLFGGRSSGNPAT